MQNHFQNVIDEVQDAVQAQRCDKLIEGITKVLQTPGVSSPQQLAQELQQMQSQIAKAFNQRQQGG